ncbi:rRNA-processing endoribonuclease, variant 2 [Bonamia ostreae]|uniref:rRNA-processing endoribonuclease, variant 2 n=1 Tax=Bonamia ostreae TaxID=126728 RepID=A0ABV2AP69_9EUKA
MQKFANFSNFRYRLIFAILSGKKIAFALNKNSRLNLHQNTFLDLCKKICNDFYTDIDKNYLVINPGTIVNGTDIEFDCGYEKPIGYFIEGILVLALFGKNDLKITFAGKTSSFGNISVDFAKNLVETLKHFGANNCVLEIKKRGSCKEMPAEISLIVSVVKSLKQVNLVDSGHVEKIRGIAFCEMVPPAIANRMSITAKKILKDFLPDVWIFTEAFNRKILINKEDKNFGICLTAESSTGSLLSGEECLHDSLSPEEVAERATKFVLKEISHV